MHAVTAPLHLIVEGWRQLPHSYALVNHYQLHELLRRPSVTLHHRDLALLNPAWQIAPGLADAADEARVMAIPAAPAAMHADVTYRIACPLDPTAGNSRHTVVFAATEFGRVLPSAVRGKDVAQFRVRLRDSGTRIVTPSEWSRQGLLASGLDAQQVHVVPHGVDPHIFRPLEPAAREDLRNGLGWNQGFIFFTNGLMWRQRHGISQLLQAFAHVTERYPQAHLVIKGREQLFGAQAEIAAVAQYTLDDQTRARVLSRLLYLGGNLSARQLAALYQCADVYVSTSQAEGFNLPALEAAACGLPVICPALGPAGEFLDPAYTLAIDSRCATILLEGEPASVVEPDIDHLTAMMEAMIERETFRVLARQEAWQRAHAEFTWSHVVNRLLPLLAPD